MNPSLSLQLKPDTKQVYSSLVKHYPSRNNISTPNVLSDINPRVPFSTSPRDISFFPVSARNTLFSFHYPRERQDIKPSRLAHKLSLYGPICPSIKTVFQKIALDIRRTLNPDREPLRTTSLYLRGITRLLCSTF